MKWNLTRATSLVIAAITTTACSESSSTSADAAAAATTDGAPAPEAGVDGGVDARLDAPADAPRDSCPSPETVTALGRDCIAFGAGSPCEAACGLPPFGYVCGGGRPDAPGCVRVSESAELGTGTYCCSELRCVRTPSIDFKCTSGTATKMRQCLEAPDGGPMADPGPGCIEANEPPPYKYFCCPN